MKTRFKLLPILIVYLLFFFTLTVSATDSFNAIKSQSFTDHCRHSVVFDFDDNSMTLEAYKCNTVEWLMEDVDYFGDKAIVYQNGELVTEGYLQVGMRNRRNECILCVGL